MLGLFPVRSIRIHRITVHLGSLLYFWERNPALLLGLSFLIGIAATFHSPLLFCALFALILLSAQKKGIAAAACALFAIAYLTTPLRFPSVSLVEKKLHGTGVFKIDTLKVQTSPFHRSLVYKGKLLEFTTEEGTQYSRLPCHIYIPVSKKHPRANCSYTIEGDLIQKRERLFVLKPVKKKEWIPIPGTFSLAECRYSAKHAVADHLKTKIKSSKARQLLTALATGEIEERALSMEFGKVGLQHILAISGFHFALAAFFLHTLFRLLLPSSASKILLIFALTLYYLFLGDSPSIQRAYCAITLITAGKLFHKRLSGLNALGAALLIELSLSPMAAAELSFQLTFLCTLSILLFYPPMLALMKQIFPERSLHALKSMRPLDQHGYLIIHFLRQTLAINLAVHLISLPILLHLFHRFPLLSIAYNLIFPLCISVSLLLLCIALVCTPLFPFLGDIVHSLNNVWTSALLQFTSNPPAYLDIALRSNRISFFFVICFLFCTFFLAAIFQEKERSTYINH